MVERKMSDEIEQNIFRRGICDRKFQLNGLFQRPVLNCQHISYICACTYITYVSFDKHLTEMHSASAVGRDNINLYA